MGVCSKVFHKFVSKVSAEPGFCQNFKRKSSYSFIGRPKSELHFIFIGLNVSVLLNMYGVLCHMK